MAEEGKKTVVTRWFNLDVPWEGGGDFETLENIENEVGRICDDGYRIVGAQCRPYLSRDDEIFSEDRVLDTGDVLFSYCDKDTGLICRTKDQIGERMCRDYEIRFQCQPTDEEPTYNNMFPEFDARIYLVLAIIPILIFLIRLLWVFIFRRRRQQQRRRRRQERRRRGEARNGEEEEDDDEDDRSINSELARPPPSYQELFSNGTPSVFAISGTNLTACPKCKDAQCSVVKGSLTAGSLQQSQTMPSAPSSVSQQSTTTTTPIDSAQSETSDDRYRRSTETQTGIRSGDEDIPLTSLDRTNNPPAVLQVDSETVGQTGAQRSDSNPPTPSTETNNQVPSSAVILSIPNDSEHTLEIPADAPAPCACACHRIRPLSEQVVRGYDNVAFTPDSEMPSPSTGPAPYRGRHIPAIPRPLSSVSIVSQITLSELPSYEDALELEKKMAAAGQAKT